jgi:hypothetical protein
MKTLLFWLFARRDRFEPFPFEDDKSNSLPHVDPALTHTDSSVSLRSPHRFHGPCSSTHEPLHTRLFVDFRPENVYPLRYLHHRTLYKESLFLFFYFRILLRRRLVDAALEQDRFYCCGLLVLCLVGSATEDIQVERAKKPTIVTRLSSTSCCIIFFVKNNHLQMNSFCTSCEQAPHRCLFVTDPNEIPCK